MKDSTIIWFESLEVVRPGIAENWGSAGVDCLETGAIVILVANRDRWPPDQAKAVRTYQMFEWLSFGESNSKPGLTRKLDT